MGKFLRRLMLLALLVLAAILFWNYENNTIQTEEFSVRSRRLPAEFSGFRVAVVADLHGREFGENNAELLQAVEAAQPDIIALCGDLIESDDQLQTVPPLAAGLTAIAPTFYVTGNHEWALADTAALLSVLKDNGVTVLGNDYRLLSLSGADIVVAGVHDPNGPADMTTPEALTEAIRAQLGDPYILMLAHRNDALERWAALDVDTVLCGHAHGGIIRLPGVGGLIGTDRQLLPEYTAGVFTLEGTDMAVSRGLGCTGLPFRLFNRPELMVIRLEQLT